MGRHFRQVAPCLGLSGFVAALGSVQLALRICLHAVAFVTKACC